MKKMRTKKSNTRLGSRIPFETLILKHLFLLFEIIALIFVMVFIYFYYQQFITVLHSNSIAETEFQTSTKSILQLGQYEKAVSFHESKKTYASATKPTLIKNPFEKY